MEPVKHIDLIKLVELTYKDVDEKHARGLEAKLEKYQEESASPLSKERVKEILEDLRGYNELEDTINASEVLIKDAAGIVSLCRMLLAIMGQRGKAPEIHSRPNRDLHDPLPSATATGEQYAEERRVSMQEKVAWDLIRDS